MNFFSKIGNALDAFKSGYIGANSNYARYSDGTDSYNLETEQFGMWSIFGFGTEYTKLKENLKYYYYENYALKWCVNLYADFTSQVKISEVDSKGNEVKNSEFVKFLNNPNPFQTGLELIKEMTVNCLVTGGVFQNGNFFESGNLRLNPFLYNLEINNLRFPKIPNRYALNSDDLNQLILKEILADSKPRNIPLAEVLMFYDTIPNNGWDKEGYSADNFFKPMARAFGIIPALNAILNAQKSIAFMTGNNVNKVISKEYMKIDQVTDLGSDQKQDIESKINGRNRYGMRADKQGDVVFSNVPIKVADLTRDNKKMQIPELKDDAFKDIRNTFLIPEDFCGASTYENKQWSESRFILGNCKPITDNWLSCLMNKTPAYFEKKGTKLIGSYDHIPAVAETKKALQNKAFTDRVSALKTAAEAYTAHKAINEKLTYEEFIINNQLNDFLSVQ